MSGYPRKKYDNNAAPYKIISKKNNDSSSVIDFKWSSYEPTSLPNE